MEGIKYINLVQIRPVVIKIQGVKIGSLMIYVNNTLVCHGSLLATDTTVCLDITRKSSQIKWKMMFFYAVWNLIF